MYVICVQICAYIERMYIRSSAHVISTQVSSCQWVLDVSLLGFHSPWNAELSEMDGNVQYCCCDNSTTCVPQVALLGECDELCDIFFIASLSTCITPQNCSISTADATMVDSVPHSSFGYFFSFTIEEMTENVSR